MGLFNKLFRSRDHPTDGRRPSNSDKLTLGNPNGWSIFKKTLTGKEVNAFTAMQTTAVYACIKVISETVASLPLHVYERDGDNSTRATKHPLYRILHLAPNECMTAYTFIEVMLTHLLLWGNSYSQIIRNGRGEVTGLYPLYPWKMKVEKDDSGELTYRYNSDKGEITIPSLHVMHIPGLGFDGHIGYSPIALARQAIGLAIAAEEFGATFYSNNASPGGLLEHPGQVKNPDALRESWHNMFSGGNAHRIAVLEEGLTFKPISIPPNDAQFLETRHFQLEEIARIYRVPLHLVGDLDHATFSNVEHLSLDFVKFTLAPWLRRIEQEIQRTLIPIAEQSTYYVRFLVEGLLRGDYKSRMEGYAIARQNGWLSANDIRRLEELNAIPEDAGGDLYLINGAMLPLNQAGAYIKDGGEGGAGFPDDETNDYLRKGGDKK